MPEHDNLVLGYLLGSLNHQMGDLFEVAAEKEGEGRKQNEGSNIAEGSSKADCAKK